MSELNDNSLIPYDISKRTLINFTVEEIRDEIRYRARSGQKRYIVYIPRLRYKMLQDVAVSFTETSSYTGHDRKIIYLQKDRVAQAARLSKCDLPDLFGGTKGDNYSPCTDWEVISHTIEKSDEGPGIWTVIFRLQAFSNFQFETDKAYKVREP